MQNLGTTGGDACPLSFNFDAASFKPGDLVSYRIPDRFDDFPFVGTLLEVHADHLLISPNDPTHAGQAYARHPREPAGGA